jgi:uncharacterized alkaline shock family protein YloU
MKIVVQLVVEVDPEAWADEYGVNKSEVRQDIKDYVLNNVQNTAGMLDTDAEVTVR